MDIKNILIVLNHWGNSRIKYYVNEYQHNKQEEISLSG